MTKMKKDCVEEGKCVELALEGERLCKSFEFDKGIIQFKAALDCGTKNERILSAIYSQLGNAYFYKKDYEKALEFHNLDLKLSQLVNDLIGESKACGNLGNTYKMLERYEEAIYYCEKHLEIARLLKDQVGESRAMYNLGNVYHLKGKTMAINSNRSLVDFPIEIKECLLKAVEYYKLNLELMKIAGDRDAQGRACGNIGNSYYLLGEFQKAIEWHSERLQIAKECGDKEAQRRAFFNLGNANIFCGEFEKSVTFYKQSLSISQEIGNPLLEAQSCFSIGNTYCLLNAFELAIEFYLKHLKFAQLLDDKYGQSRACWSLRYAYNGIGDTEEALRFGSYHLKLAKEINDKEGFKIASENIINLKRKLEEQSNSRYLADISKTNIWSKEPIATEHNLKVKDGIDYFQKKQEISDSTSKLIEVVNESEFFSKNNLLKRNFNQLTNCQNNTAVKVFNSRPISETSIKQQFGKSLERVTPVLNHYQTPVKSDRKRFQSRKSMENMEIMKLTPTTTTTDNKTNHSTTDQIDNKQITTNSKLVTTYSKAQQPKVSANSSFLNKELDDNDLFLDLLANFQSKRMDDQRCSLDLIDNKENHLPDHKPSKAHKTSLNRSISTACSGSSSKMENQGNESKEIKRRNSNPISYTESTSTLTSTSATTQECRDELFDLIEGIQSRRMDEQRAPLPPLRRSHTTQETVPKNTSSSTIASSIDSQTDSRTKILNRMSTNVEITDSQQIKQNRQMSFSTGILPDDDFFEMLIKCQSTRLEDQRTTLPTFAEAANNNNNDEVINQNLINNSRLQINQSNQSRNEDEFLNLLMRFQAGRIEEQRSNLPKDEEDLINLNSSSGSSRDIENLSANKKD